MTPDPSLFVKKIRHLSQALIISGAVNIGVLSLLLYWMLTERPPTPYCELKPASYEQQQAPLADQREVVEVLAQLSQLAFPQLVESLSHQQVIESGYAECDLALACLMALHHFDLQRALPRNEQPRQQRLLAWKPDAQKTPITLVVYPDLTPQQFKTIIQFAKIERWPFTAEGLFLLLKQQQKEKTVDPSLIDTFSLTPEFWTVELLFNRSHPHIDKNEILTLLLEGEWTTLKQFVDRQRQVHDQSDARRQRFLLDYLKAGCPSAAALLLKKDWEFAVKKLDDQQVITMLQNLPKKLPESTRFTKEMLTSPRSTKVWQQAVQWLYVKVGEPMPKEWNYQQALDRFVSNKPQKDLQPQAAAPPAQNLTPHLTPRTYIVQEGDSLWKIARRLNLTTEQLKQHNQLQSDVLKVGSVLSIPEKK